MLVAEWLENDWTEYPTLSPYLIICGLNGANSDPTEMIDLLVADSLQIEDEKAISIYNVMRSIDSTVKAVSGNEEEDDESGIRSHRW
jgi:hypothetical protein